MRNLKRGIVWLSIICLIFTSDTGAAVSNSNSSAPCEESISVDSVDYYLNEFHNLSRKEKKLRLKEAKRYWRDQKKTNIESSSDGDIVFLAILSLLIPPLAVYLKEKKITNRFWITILLWFLFILPGIVFALLIVFGVI